MATRKQNWGEDRVMYFDARGTQRSMPASWTSVTVGDAFAQAAGGRSWFRVDDLLRLHALIDVLQDKGERGVK